MEPQSDVDYFQKLADGAPIMIWMSGSDMGCFYFNRAWLDFRGRTTEQEFGNGWAEGVHPDDLERCVQHYVGSFEQRLPFAMSYRLQNHRGEYRWILDRGAPHHAANGDFLGFFGGCAETEGASPVERISELRGALLEMREFAHRMAVENSASAPAGRLDSSPTETVAHRRRDEYHAQLARRQNAVAQLQNLASDMIAYGDIRNGACLR